ncbi:tripartite tricarboxylate transporter TctB family protein [Marinovum sp.]|uniref:tripartite tricarboxylate transporter TctB family protein n=1 Tax=Marinovum sp. TaxID=2024839 RepID=UPI003A94EAF3
MNSRTQEIATGAGIAAFGAATIVLSVSDLSIGTLRSPGPGLFPVSMGVVLVFLGLVVAGLALLQQVGERVYLRQPDWRSLGMVSLSIVAFIFGFKFLGLLPAIFLSTLVSSFADPKLTLRKAAILGVGLALLAGLIFRVALGMHMPLLLNPFGG